MADILDAANLKAVAFGGLINEDVMQKIWDISKIPLPLTDRIGTDDASNSYKEWTVDELADPDITNAVQDGADATGNNNGVGERQGNHCQISVKQVAVSTRAQNTDNIGRSDELAYQVMMRQQELRRDVEAIMLTRQASQADDGSAGSSPGQSGGLGAWLKTNTSRGATTGADGGFNTGTGVVGAPTAGDLRAASEGDIRDVCEKVYNEGGNPSILMSTPTAIRKFSEYLFTSSARVATLMSDTGQSEAAVTAKGSVNVFVTDFDVTLDLVPNRLQQPVATNNVDMFIIDPAYLSLAFLHGYRTEPLAKTGLSDKRQMAVDWTLVVHNEKAHGVVADVNPTLDATA